jgi:hypothetical protein
LVFVPKEKHASILTGGALYFGNNCIDHCCLEGIALVTSPTISRIKAIKFIDDENFA